MTHVWRTLLMPQSNNPQVQVLAPAMEAWLRKRLTDNMPYDQMVRDLLTTNVVQNQAMRQGFNIAGPVDNTGQAFFQANELKPENLAAATSRLFLGVKLECAQCHNHPFAKWQRKQFWEFAAFFSGVGPQAPQQGQVVDDDGGLIPASDAAHRHDIKMPNSEKVVQARVLDGKKPVWKEDVPTRVALAEWMTSPDNPYFARTAAVSLRLERTCSASASSTRPTTSAKTTRPATRTPRRPRQGVRRTPLRSAIPHSGDHVEQDLSAHQPSRGRPGRRPAAVHAHVGPRG